MEKDIFQLASNYRFDAIVDYFNSGNSINICSEYGSSLFAAFIDGYGTYGDIDENYDELDALHDESDYEFWDGFLLEKQKTPLSERNNGVILKQLDWFLSNGAEINLCDISKTGWVYTPLSFAVIYEDYYLTEYLLQHGADPMIWLSNDPFPWKKHEDWLIEHMDACMMWSRGDRFENELNIAALLAKHGLDDFGGICISIDKENHIVTGHSPQWLF